jgi:putative ABC transport system permease protein
MDRANVVMIPFHQMGHYAAFKQDIARIPGIRGVATSSYPLYGGSDGWAVQGPGSDKAVQLLQLGVDSGYFSLLGIKWIEKPAYGARAILNESAVAKLGLEGEPVGQRIKFANQDIVIGGVVKDYVFSQMRSAIEPLLLTVRSDSAGEWAGPGRRGGCLVAKIGAHTNIPTVIGSIRKLYRQYDPQTAFEYSFADEAFDSQYKAEDRLAGLMGVFTFITILIACLGLFALATFAAQQRVREIGIRKVLGASAGSIGFLLSRDFLRPVLLAIVLACPLSWWAMHRWLEDFAYRTTLSWWVFAVSASGLLLVALATVLLRSLRAGRANPVANLRSE